jgi:hypothetical protein
MLDSTGQSFDIHVDCVFCHEKVSLRTYTPEYGHDGQALGDIGSCFEKHLSEESRKDWKKFCDGGLFKFVPNYTERPKGRLHIKTTELVYNYQEFYFYNQPTVPKFGIGPNLTFWLCPHCCRKDISSAEKRLGEILKVLQKNCAMWREYVTKTEPTFEQEAKKQWRRNQRVRSKETDNQKVA